MFKFPSFQPIPMLFVALDPNAEPVSSLKRKCSVTEQLPPCSTTGVTVSGPLSARITGKWQLSHLANIGADSRAVWFITHPLAKAHRCCREKKSLTFNKHVENPEKEAPSTAGSQQVRSFVLTWNKPKYAGSISGDRQRWFHHHWRQAMLVPSLETGNAASTIGDRQRWFHHWRQATLVPSSLQTGNAGSIITGAGNAGSITGNRQLYCFCCLLYKNTLCASTKKSVMSYLTVHHTWILWI